VRATTAPGSRRRFCTVDAIYFVAVGRNPYRPAAMATTSGHRTIRRASKSPLVIVATIVFPLGLSACGGAASAPATGPHRAAPGLTATSRNHQPGAEGQRTLVDRQVLSAWLASEQAFHDAALTANPDAPELAATTVQPQLGGREKALAGMRASGEIARGPTDYGSPRVTRLSARQAVIRACIHDSEIVVSASTGQPVPGSLGEIESALLTSEMELTEGGWKLLTQTVAQQECEQA